MSSLNYTIYISSNAIDVSISNTSTCSDLLEEVRDQYSRIYSLPRTQVLGLKSVGGQEVLDSWLTKLNKPAPNLPQRQNSLVAMLEDKECDRSLTNLKFKDFEFEKCIGKGGTSEVYLVRHLPSARLFALKQINKSLVDDSRRLEQILLEKAIMEKIDFPFIATLYATFESADHLNFLMDFYPGGELFFHLQQRRLNEEECKFYFCEILIALEHLHSLKVLYRDLKPENLLLDEEGHVRITDFGLSKYGLEKTSLTDSFCGSPEYMAPEVIQPNGYSYPVDFYTLGALLFELTTGLPPFYDNDPEQIMRNIVEKELEYPNYLSRDLVTLLKSLLYKDVSKRMSDFEKIKSHPWLSNIYWPSMYSKSISAPIKINLFKSYIHEEFLEKEVFPPFDTSFKPEFPNFTISRFCSSTKLSKGGLTNNKIEISAIDKAKLLMNKSYDLSSSKISRQKPNSTSIKNLESKSASKLKPTAKKIPLSAKKETTINLSSKSLIPNSQTIRRETTQNETKTKRRVSDEGHRSVKDLFGSTKNLIPKKKLEATRNTLSVKAIINEGKKPALNLNAIHQSSTSKPKSQLSNKQFTPIELSSFISPKFSKTNIEGMTVGSSGLVFSNQLSTKQSLSKPTMNSKGINPNYKTSVSLKNKENIERINRKFEDDEKLVQTFSKRTISSKRINSKSNAKDSSISKKAMESLNGLYNEDLNGILAKLKNLSITSTKNTFFGKKERKSDFGVGSVNGRGKFTLKANKFESFN